MIFSLPIIKSTKLLSGLQVYASFVYQLRASLHNIWINASINSKQSIWQNQKKNLRILHYIHHFSFILQNNRVQVIFFFFSRVSFKEMRFSAFIKSVEFILGCRICVRLWGTTRAKTKFFFPKGIGLKIVNISCSDVFFSKEDFFCFQTYTQGYKFFDIYIIVDIWEDREKKINEIFKAISMTENIFEVSMCL